MSGRLGLRKKKGRKPAKIMTKVKQSPGFDQGRGLDADGLRLDRTKG